MRLHRTMIPREGVRRTFRHPLESQWIAGSALSLPVVAAALTVPRVASGLVALAGMPFALLYLWILWDAARGSRRASNWHVKLTDKSLLLNLRSWRNARCARGDTLVEIDFEEVRSAGLVFERVAAAHGAPGFQRALFVELALSIDTAPIRAALDDERARPAPGGRLSRGRSRHPHEPVQVTGQGLLRLEVAPGLLEALCEHVRLRPDREACHDVERESQRAA